MRVLRIFHHIARGIIRLNSPTSRTTQEGLPRRISEGNYFYFLYRSNCTCACFEKYVPSVEKVLLRTAVITSTVIRFVQDGVE